MHLSKLTIALKAFSEPQFRRLKEYVHSPYFKVPAASATLFDYLYTLYPSFPEKKIQPAILKRKAANLSTASAQSWAGTELLHAIEQFISVEHYRANPSTMMLHQLHGSHELGLFQHFHKDYSEALQQLNQCPAQHTDTFYHRHMFAELSFNQQDLLRKNGKPSDITPAVTSLDEFYALKKLHYLCEAHVRNQISEAVFPPKQISALLKTLQPYNSAKYPSAYLFVNICHLLFAPTYQQSLPFYNRLKQYACSKGVLRDLPPAAVTTAAVTTAAAPPPAAPPPPALSEAISYIVHHCLHWYNKGVEQAGKEYLGWVEIKMKYGWLLQEDKLNPVTFRNILLIALDHKSAGWMHQFITLCHPYLSEENIETNLAFANGLLHYRLKKYKEAVRFFLMAQAKEQPLFNCLIRRWQWMSGYECDLPAGRHGCQDAETLEHQLRLFERYLNRNKKALGQNKIAFNKFILYAAALWSVSSPAIRPRQLNESHLRNLENEPHFPGKHWLLKQVALKQQTKPVKEELIIDN